MSALYVPRLRAAFGAGRTADPSSWTWTDITTYLHKSTPVRHSWGRDRNATGRQPHTLSLALRNHDGRFTWSDPRSPYYPWLVNGVPIEWAVDVGSGYEVRFRGYVDGGWPVEWPGGSSKHALTRITATSISGLLKQGERPTRTALGQDITAADQAETLLAYWPCNDGQDAGGCASGIPGHPPLAATGDVQFGATDPGLQGMGSVPDLSGGGRLSGPVPVAGTASPVEWTAQFFAEEATASGATDPYVLAEWQDSAGATWDIRFTGSPNFNTQLRRDGIAIIEDGTSFIAFFEWRVVAWQNGTNISAQLIINGQSQGDVSPGGGGPWTASVASNTLGWPTRVTLNPASASTAGVHGIGEVQVWKGTSPPSYVPASAADSYGRQVTNATRGFLRETAVDRITRVCAASSIPLTVVDSVDAAHISRMTYQPAATDLQLIDACVLVDGGILGDELGGWGLELIPRQHRYNPATVLTLDGSAREVPAGIRPIPASTADMRNQWTASRPGGSSATAVDQAHVQQHGRLSGQQDYDLLDDTELANIASLQVHLGTDESPRYDRIAIKLHAKPDLITQWLAVRPGTKVVATNLPPQHPPGDAQIVVTGGEETWQSGTVWDAAVWGRPARPWQVGALGTSTRLDTAGSETTADFDSGVDTALSVQRSAGTVALWTVNPAMYPFDIVVGGVRLTATACSGTSDPQTFTVDQAPVDGVEITIPAGSSVRLADPWRLAR
ncbi:hypothetical protein EDC02_5947 [Micromonospora sp. Llam0]|uniref:hypothetical protein n=1 Tax=Micromonospora sp. Llam0 TaxID=2485143 RepID=UPI000F47F5BC|nr:hypothetical protein [Micromonospora sp. Llam0]ROO51083.1 hypothetical protein EDC02_5947 [Micromonospora sp. Llam0]